MTSDLAELRLLSTYLEHALEIRKYSGPVNLNDLIKDLGKYDQVTFKDDISAALTNHLESCDINDEILDSLTTAIQKWDNDDNPEWAKNTEKYSLSRREKILSLLGFNPSQHTTINKRILRFSKAEIPIVIAEAHIPWYEQRKKEIRGYYWNDYIGQLKKPKGNWDNSSIGLLDISTDDVLSRFSDPWASDVYPVKGLVVGYVQSGKTSHFNGLIAKAADAGYRLFIILSGTTDILRRQTQRRIDKDIIGHDIIDFKEYGSDDDWPKFVTHEVSIQDGRFEWERLTNKSEYKSLSNHPSLLEFKKQNPNLPFNHPENLKNARARIAVIKKVPVILDKLIADLKSIHELKTKLDNVPTLIIDDESDQASINTIDQSKPGRKGDRTRTNRAIGELLKLIPRAQYVGYTATPFANVFIDPEDADDLFPKDFIISLQRPQGYMGGADFYDFIDEYEEDDYRSNKNAFIRTVEDEDDKAENLPRAIDSFVLAGAIKLYRQEMDPDHYRYPHHTMLIHHAAKQIVHEEDKQIVDRIFLNGARYFTQDGIAKLESLFNTDFLPVSKLRASEAPFPSTFGELKPYISKCISMLTSDKPVRIINCSARGHLDEPDFEQAPVWAILVGGTKLSRGYTVEGLTISYYRRPAGAGDTLMQMGRWYGFRHGYNDLVRLFIGIREQRGNFTIDLYEAFGALVRSEEELRRELQKYSATEFTPKQVPPLVRQLLPYLPPASKNKMFNAVIKSQDFAGEYTEKVSASNKINDKKKNADLARILIEKSVFTKSIQTVSFINNRNASRKFNCLLGKISGRDTLDFLEKYIWVDEKKSVYLETEYIKKMLESGRLSKWHILLPQIVTGTPRTFNGTKLGPLTTVERKLAFEKTFAVYSEPRHREAASYLAVTSDVGNPNTVLVENRNPEYPVIIMYFVIPKEDQTAEITVGFGIQYPGTKKDFSLVWGVSDSSNADLIVVDTPQD